MAPLAAALQTAIDKIEVCKICGNIDTQNPCTVCTDPRRDPAAIVVVADVADLWALERAHAINARYHVLGGTLSPLDGVGPDDLVDRRADQARARSGRQRNHPRAQCHGRRPEHGPLHHRPPARRQGQGDAAGAWRAGRRRTRLPRRGHAGSGDAQPDAVLGPGRAEDARKLANLRPQRGHPWLPGHDSPDGLQGFDISANRALAQLGPQLAWL